MKIASALGAVIAACGVLLTNPAFAYFTSPLLTAATPSKKLQSVAASSLSSTSLAFLRFNHEEEAASSKANPTHLPSGSLILRPPEEKLSHKHNALVLLPGCLLRPHQYETLAKAVQQASKQAMWVVVPKLPLDMANPLTVPRAVQDSVKALRDAGYAGEKLFVGGHSLGGIFLPNLFDEKDFNVKQIAGLIQLGCFVSREHRKKLKTVAFESFDKTPRLILSGDLDGLIRVSRIAEDFHNHVVVKGNMEEQRLYHSVILVKGMNHFQFVEGKYPIMEQVRDLKPEISNDEAVQAVSSAIGEFMDYHSLEEKDVRIEKHRLLAKISATEAHLAPILQAMALEGSYHMATPCHYCDDEDGSCDLDCNEGSPWAAKIQEHILATHGLLGLKADRNSTTVKDEFRESWWINPFADPPFYHPHVHVDDGRLKLGTVTEAVYEKTDYFFFDGGFFSNTALELRSKFNSVEAILHAMGDTKGSMPSDSSDADTENICSKMNAVTIKWALEHAPDIVKKRYLNRGIKLKAGQDVAHNSGPSWIWTYLDFSKTGDCGNDLEDYGIDLTASEDEECRIVDSHTMQTTLEHPIPAARGKLYCKLLSPARVLDWMYTDSLRGSRN